MRIATAVLGLLLLIPAIRCIAGAAEDDEKKFVAAAAKFQKQHPKEPLVVKAGGRKYPVPYIDTAKVAPGEIGAVGGVDHLKVARVIDAHTLLIVPVTANTPPVLEPGGSYSNAELAGAIQAGLSRQAANTTYEDGRPFYLITQKKTDGVAAGDKGAAGICEVTGTRELQMPPPDGSRVTLPVLRELDMTLINTPNGQSRPKAMNAAVGQAAAGGPAAAAGKSKGNLAVLLKGDTLEVYVNGVKVHSSKGNDLQSVPLTLGAGDCVVFRANSPFAYRTLRFAFVSASSAASFVGTPATTVIRRLSDPNATVPKERFDAPAATPGRPDPRNTAWQDAKLPEGAQPIGLPEKHATYEIAFTVPGDEKAQKEGEAKQEPKAADPDWRTWTSSDGKYTVDAKFDGMTSKVVKLVKRDGTVVKVPLETLSADDQEFIAKRKEPAVAKDRKPAGIAGKGAKPVGAAKPAPPAVLTRDQFRSEMRGKSQDDILAYYGKPVMRRDVYHSPPDSTSGTAQILWTYNGLTTDPHTGKADGATTIVFEDVVTPGVWTAVNFIYAPLGRGIGH